MIARARAIDRETQFCRPDVVLESVARTPANCQRSMHFFSNVLIQSKRVASMVLRLLGFAVISTVVSNC